MMKASFTKNSRAHELEVPQRCPADFGQLSTNFAQERPASWIDLDGGVRPVSTYIKGVF